jgi:septal ring factor EnvC (AmiA/AmiB activator)
MKQPIITKIAVAILTAAVLLLPDSPWSFSAVNKLYAAQQTSSRIAEYQARIDKILGDIKNQQSKVEEERGLEKSLLAAIEKLDQQLADQQSQLDELQKQVEDQQRFITEQQQQLAMIQEKTAVVKEHLQKRITAYYTMGELGLYNVTFSTKSLPELLSFYDFFDTIISYDKSVMTEYKQTRDELQSMTKALELEKVVLEDFYRQASIEKEAMVETRKVKQQLLARVRTQAQLHQQAIVELQKDSKKLVDSIVTLKGRNQTEKNNFVANKGSLPPPVDGALITLFQQQKTNKFGVTKNLAGIELRALDGKKVVAVSDGEVIFSGYLSGYGNTVIIHHGYQYYTVTSRIEKLISKKGQQVKREETIGLVGDTATLFDEGLYFEIRHGKESLDPLLWLDPNRLSAQYQ